MENRKKILIVTPKLPWPMTGACEADRAEGIKQLIRLGFDIKLIVKLKDYQSENIDKIKKELAIDIFPISYKYHKQSRLLKYIKIFFTKPNLLDGAAYEYTDPELLEVFKKQINNWKPDYLWLDYTFMWPLAKIAKNKNIKVITRSINYEPEHFVQEEGNGLLHSLIYKAKIFTEKQTIKYSDLIFAITPHDKKIYDDMGAANVKVLPLRALPNIIKNGKDINYKKVLNIFFAGSTYNVPHNKKALEMVIKDIAPKVNKRFLGKFIFNILGGKFPEEFKKYLNDNVKYLGFVEDYEATMFQMDVALIPSLYGGGMQQKIFEPMARGIPTISSKRGLADYPFKHNQHILLADDVDNFVYNLGKMLDTSLRKKLSKESIKLSTNLFSKDKIDAIVKDNIN